MAAFEVQNTQVTESQDLHDFSWMELTSEWVDISWKMENLLNNTEITVESVTEQRVTSIIDMVNNDEDQLANFIDELNVSLTV